MKLFIILTFLFLTVIPSTSAPASDTEEDHICFMGIDKDQNGWMSFQEFIPVYGKDKEKFTLMDDDKDGRVSHDDEAFFYNEE